MCSSFLCLCGKPNLPQAELIPICGICGICGNKYLRIKYPTFVAWEKFLYRMPLTNFCKKAA